MVSACDLCASGYEPGQEGQVDWYEAWAELAGEPRCRCRYSRCAAWRVGQRFTEHIIERRSRHSWKATNTRLRSLAVFFRTLRYKDGRANPRQSHALKAPRIPAANAPNRLAGIDPQSSRPGHTTALPQMDQRPRSFGA